MLEADRWSTFSCRRTSLVNSAFVTKRGAGWQRSGWELARASIYPSVLYDHHSPGMHMCLLAKIFLGWIFACDWKDDEHDEAVRAALDQLLQQVEQLASEKELLLTLRFPTFAGSHQDVLGGFGVDIVKELRETASKYDPDGLFQSLQCGGFLLRDI